MRKTITISENDKWQAVVSCDNSFDGLFFYGVRTTGIFCRPSCPAKTPLLENVLFFADASQAVQKGFRPCKKCRPDQEKYEPDLELVNKAKATFDANSETVIDYKQVSKELGVSLNHLIKLFGLHCGLTPAQYVTTIRVSKAAELLTQTELSILEVCFLSGFKSVSSFYKCFKHHTGYTPREFIKKSMPKASKLD